MHFPIKVLTSCASCFFYFSCTSCFNISTNNLVAVYWGQNSISAASKSHSPHSKGNHNVVQPSLLDICKQQNVDIVLISFMDDFPGKKLIPRVSLWPEIYSPKNGKASSTLESHISQCQAIYGKRVMLSLGGQSGNYGFSSKPQAVEFADLIWQTFGLPHKPQGSGYLPFGNVVLDGIDLDIEKGKNTKYYVDFVRQLRRHSGPHNREFFISASPECLYPDKHLKQALENSDIWFDFLFIQFYNNPECNANSDGFNWFVWVNEYAVKTNHNQDLRLFLGLPADSSMVAAENGYISSQRQLQEKIAYIFQDSSLSKWIGGISLWDASLAVNNFQLNPSQNYIDVAKHILNFTRNNHRNISVPDYAPPSQTAQAQRPSSLTFALAVLLCFHVLFL